MLDKSKDHVDVLGTKYTLVFEQDKNNEKLKHSPGYIDTSVKKIVVQDNFEANSDNIEDLESFQERVLCHEIIHAFLHESGLDANCTWAFNEEVVDWFALQLPKIGIAVCSVLYK